MHDEKNKGLDGVQKLLIFGGFICFLGSLGAAFGGVEFFMETCVRYTYRLSKDNWLWDQWKETPMPIYYKFYIFSITNPNRLKHGEKPRLKEMGPYTYLVKMPKKDVTFNAKADTIKYRQSKRLFFQPGMSSGKETDEITYINMIYIAVSHMAHDMSDSPSVMETIDGKLSGAGEELTITSTVKQILFTGISIQPYLDLMQEPAVQSAGEFVLPEQFADGKFAVFKDKEGADADGYWVIRAGNRNPNDVARILSINGKKKMSYWKHNSCNMYNGTDGIFNQPFIVPGVTKLQAYAKELCRSITWQFVNTTISRGVFTARYTLPDFKTPQEEPASWCFCPDDDTKKCNIMGMASLKPCYGGAPLMVSKPHFYKTDPAVGKTVVGLSPDKEKHESVLDLHAYTGTTLHAIIRIQFSIELMNWPDMPSFVNAPRAMVPFVWVEQNARLGVWVSAFIRVFETFRRAWPTLRFIVVLLFLGVICGGFALVYKSRTSNDYDEDELIAKTNVEVLARDFAAGFGDKYQTQYSNSNGNENDN